MTIKQTKPTKLVDLDPHIMNSLCSYMRDLGNNWASINMDANSMTKDLYDVYMEKLANFNIIPDDSNSGPWDSLYNAYLDALIREQSNVESQLIRIDELIEQAEICHF